MAQPSPGAGKPPAAGQECAAMHLKFTFSLSSAPADFGSSQETPETHPSEKVAAHSEVSREAHGVAVQWTRTVGRERENTRSNSNALR